MIRNYINIDFVENLDAKSYYQVTPTVEIQGKETLKYLNKAIHEYNYIEFLEPFFANLPEHITGKFRMSNKKIIDYWEIAPCYLQSFIAIVSQRFVDVLAEIGVSTDEYFLKEIDIINNKSGLAYYLFFVPVQHMDKVVFNESVFIQHRGLDTARNINFENEDELNSYQGDYCYLTHATLKFEDKIPDVVNFRNCVSVFFSERLFQALENHEITGYRVSKYHTLKVITND